ncbi:PWWP domain-containing protein [Psidium guajava]|nr:PWWP domain-containing protein [Psidium guajava]
MESSGGSGDCGVGLGVGSIVWVRRRNGSWWPGKILGPDELSTAHLTSPRAGTPVKLLGREDASVDWYNLEKSKRVKAFRCGEFDECIERAESSQGMPMKKREKYARREDAILHALELEKEMLKKQGKFEIESKFVGGNSPTGTKKGFIASSEILENGNDELENPVSPHFTRRLGVSGRDHFTTGSSLFQQAKDGEELRQDDGLPEGVPRMRGLQDFGLKIAPSKRKHSMAWKPKMNRDAHAQSESEEVGIFRAKRSKCVYFPSGPSDSLDDKGTPQSRMEMLPSVLREGSRDANLMAQGTSGISESSDTGSTESDLSDSESDSSETEEDADEETTSFSEAERGAFGIHEARVQHDSMSSEEPEDSALSGDNSHLFPRDTVSANEAVSKWQLKGKRNIRNVAKRHLDAAEGTPSDGRRVSSRRRAPIWRSGEYRNYDFTFDDADDEEKDLETEIFGLDHEYIMTPRAASRDQGFRSWSMLGFEDMYLEGERNNPALVGQHHFGGNGRGMLVEVDLKVHVTYQKGRVPITSMTSKLNGNSIIGHSIQTEAIEDGSTEHLLPANYEDDDGAIDYNGIRTVPSAWKTARRTANFRIPRPNRSSAIDGCEDGGESLLFGQEGRSQKNASAGNFSRKGVLVRKAFPQIPPPQSDKKLSGKSSKRAGLSSSQKIRTLSSIALEPDLGNKAIHDSFDSAIVGIIKPNSSGPTTVACIPVKLVYSRLLEKINRPPSKAVMNAVRFNGETEKSGS